MSRWKLCAAAAAVFGVAVATAGSTLAAVHAGGVVVTVSDKGTSFVPNKSVTDTMYFSPATITVKSGQMLTFKYGSGPKDEPHTLTIVPKQGVPRTPGQVNNCNVCNQEAAGHLKNPKAEPGPTNDIVHWVLDKGKSGLDEVGDSVAIEGAAHHSISIEVTAPAGTTLYFVCAVHPWMQGELKVT